MAAAEQEASVGRFSRIVIKQFHVFDYSLLELLELDLSAMQALYVPQLLVDADVYSVDTTLASLCAAPG